MLELQGAELLIASAREVNSVGRFIKTIKWFTAALMENQNEIVMAIGMNVRPSATLVHNPIRI